MNNCTCHPEDKIIYGIKECPGKGELISCIKESITPSIPWGIDGLREPLAQFAARMEQKLRKNDHKTGWRQLPVEALIRLMHLEIEEFKVADEFFPVDEARKELVDVANFCMMLHDRLGMLPHQDEIRKTTRNDI